MLPSHCTTLIATTGIALAAGSALAESDQRFALTGLLDQAATLKIPGVQYHELAELSMPEGLPEITTIAIPIRGTTYNLELFSHSLRTSDFRLLVDNGLGIIETDAAAPRTYRGTVDGIEGSSARASLLPDGFHGMVDLGDTEQGGGGTWFIQPISSLAPDGVIAPVGSTENTHVIIPAQSGFLPGYICGNSVIDLALPDDLGDQRGGADSDAGGGLAGVNTYYVEVGMDSDYEFFQKNGYSVSATMSDIELIWNLIETVYERDVLVNFEISAIVVRSSSSDPYSSSNDAGSILCEFRNLWNSSSSDEYGIRRDVAQIFTGKNVAGSVLGVAWLGVVCNLSGNDCSGYGNLAYGMVESRYTSNVTYRANLSAHELGHNFSAGHCDNQSECRIMCSGNGGCDSITGSNFKFAPSSISAITNFRGSMSCDTTFGDPLDLPFTDDFSSISTMEWVYNDGGLASTGASNEPSGTRSLQLDSTGADPYDDDEIRSQNLNASGYDPLFISFWTQHRGVEAGKTLIVEYYNSSSDWTELTTVTSDGTTQSAFNFHEFEMGADAKTNRLRFRFRVDGDSSSDDWYIDDLMIGDEINSVDPPANDNCQGALELVDGGQPFTTLGAGDSEVPNPTGCVIGNDVWFYYVRSCVGTATITTCGSAGQDTTIAVYSSAGGCPSSNDLLLACNSDAGCDDDALVQFDTEANTVVYVRVGSSDGSTADDSYIVVTCEETSNPCPPDFNNDGVIDGADLASLLGNWGTANGDLNDDGTTDGADLSIVLGYWGPCT